MIDKLVEVKLNQDEDFLKVRETLTRIGIASKKKSYTSPVTFFINRENSI